jgi:hypothetical protein
MSPSGSQSGAQPTACPGSAPRMFGSSLAEVFSVPDYHCMLEGSHEKPDFAVTRLCSGPTPAARAPAYPADDALLVCVSLTPTAIGQWRARHKGRQVGVTRAIPFATTVLDLLCSMEMWVRGPFDYLHSTFPPHFCRESHWITALPQRTSCAKPSSARIWLSRN